MHIKGAGSLCITMSTPAVPTAQDPESEYGSDTVKVFSHEGDGENTEHLNSMDLHDVKTELERDAEKAEVSVCFCVCSCIHVRSSRVSIVREYHCICADSQLL